MNYKLKYIYKEILKDGAKYSKSKGFLFISSYTYCVSVNTNRLYARDKAGIDTMIHMYCTTINSTYDLTNRIT